MILLECLDLHLQVANHKLERANTDLTEAKRILEEEKLQREALLQRQVLALSFIVVQCLLFAVDSTALPGLPNSAFQLCS